MTTGRVYVSVFVLAACSAWGEVTDVATAQTDNPTLVHVGMVTPDTLGITVQAGRIEYGRQMPYQRQDKDQIRGDAKDREVYRDGKFLGWLIGREKNLIYSADELQGTPLETRWADDVASYRLASSDDSRYAQPVKPVTIFRKTKPSDLGRLGGWKWSAPLRHVIYLRFAHPLQSGCHYRLEFTPERLPPHEFHFDPRTQRSEAVHVSQIGFRSDDPVKLAFLSCWLGSGGPAEYASPLKFALLDDSTGDVVVDGTLKLAKSASDRDEDAYGKNYAGVDVYEMDFSQCKGPGVYRVCVEGVGCSYPFPIREDVWRSAFTISARGFYHQRSGIALGPPFTTFQRRRCFVQADGLVVWQSSCPLMFSANGINALGTDQDNFGNLVSGKTNEQVSDAWGGYMDAGDWDRRIQHLIVTRYLVDLADLFPEYFASVSLNIPESPAEYPLPDIVDEGLFNLDCYRRMQTLEGGIRGGIESAEHPRHGEGSWQESLDVMAYAPGIWSSYMYAGVAAQAAYWIATHDPTLAQTYRESALRAMVWAEREYVALQSSDRWSKIEENARHQLRDERNLAAADLFRLTGDEKWHQVFLETTKFRDAQADLAVWQSHDQREAVWVYLRTDRVGVDPGVQANCRAALLREAEDRLRSTQRTGFRFAKEPWRPGAWGAFSAPDAVTLVRAHSLTKEVRFLRAAILACQVSVGANPLNLCYTTGVGHDSPQHPLHIDSRITHQPPPPGLTVLGPADVALDKDNWAQKLVAPHCFPDVQQWPALDAYWDVFWYPSMCEFTVQTPMAANAYVWGYLSARP